MCYTWAIKYTTRTKLLFLYLTFSIGNFPFPGVKKVGDIRRVGMHGDYRTRGANSFSYSHIVIFQEYLYIGVHGHLFRSDCCINEKAQSQNQYAYDKNGSA